MSAQTTYLDLDLIRTDGGTQSRALLNKEVINEYANLFDASNSWNVFPPIIVFYDGAMYWLADGFHRLEAAKKSGLKNIDCFVNQGTQRDAILFSVGANAEHGLRRNDDDKRRAVTTLLNDNEWNCWSDNQIAKKCKVSQPFVSKVRKELGNSTVNVDSKEQRTYERNGKTHNMKTNNIGRSQLTKENQDRDPNAKEMFNSEQFKEAVKQEVEKTNPELGERFNQDIELPSYNVISEELFLKKEFIKGQAEKIAELEKLLDLGDKFYKQAEYNQSKTREELAKVEQELIQVKDVKEQLQYLMSIATHQAAKLIGLNQEIITWENVLDKLKEIMKLTNKVSEITEANNQLFVANENLTKELNEIKQNNVDLEKKVKEFEDDNFNLENEVNELKDELHKNNLEIITIHQERYKLEHKVNELTKENETLKEANNQILVANENLTCEIKNVNNKLKIAIKPNGYDQLDKMLVLIQNEFEYSLEKGAKKREGIRIGRTASNELLNAIKQARGVE